MYSSKAEQGDKTAVEANAQSLWNNMNGTYSQHNKANTPGRARELAGRPRWMLAQTLNPKPKPESQNPNPKPETLNRAPGHALDPLITVAAHSKS